MCEQGKYELVKTDGGAVVYHLQEEWVNRGEVQHYICPSCYMNKKGRYILQPDKEKSHFMTCSGGCGGTYRVNKRPPIAARIVG